MRGRTLARWSVAAVSAALAVAAGCAGGDGTVEPATAEDGLRIASFDFVESRLLAELYAQVLEAADVPVVRLGVVGPREIVAPSLELGLVDLVPEYLGSALQHAGADTPEPDTGAALVALDDLLGPRGLTVLDAAPAEDENVLVVRIADAQVHGLRTISDLVALAPGLTIGGPAECPDRPLCLAGLASVYGLEFAAFEPQRSIRFTVEALQREEIDVGVLFSTAAPLVTGGLVVLDDDLRMQPAENVVPVVRLDALEQWGPEVRRALDEVSAALTTLELRTMNVRVEHEPVEDVVRSWLLDHGLIG